MSIANFLETKILDKVFNNTDFTVVNGAFAKLHVGDPGEDGTANPAAETTRKAVSFGAASGGAISNDALVEWTAYPANETVSHVSLWDAATAGNPLWVGPLSAAKALTIGDTFQIPIGDLDVTLD